MIDNTCMCNLSYILRDGCDIYRPGNMNSRPIPSHTGGRLKPSINSKAQCPKCCLMIIIDSVLPDVVNMHITVMKWLTW